MSKDKKKYFALQKNYLNEDSRENRKPLRMQIHTEKNSLYLMGGIPPIIFN